MTDDARVRAIEAVLRATEAAHGVYEATELGGVYDEVWPQWYAEYAVDHGIGEAMARPINATELADRFISLWEQVRRGEITPSEPWATYTARSLAKDD